MQAVLVDIDFIDVAPAPLFSAFGRLDDRMMRCSEVGACVPVFRRVATAYMAAFQAHAQMDPCIARLQAIFAAFGRRLYRFHMIFDMLTG
jgi:hypothetical protein